MFKKKLAGSLLIYLGVFAQIAAVLYFCCWVLAMAAGGFCYLLGSLFSSLSYMGEQVSAQQNMGFAPLLVLLLAIAVLLGSNAGIFFFSKWLLKQAEAILDSTLPSAQPRTLLPAI